MMRRAIFFLFLPAVFILTTCTLDHSNAFDPLSPLRSPNAIPFKYSDNIKSIEPTAIELTWQRSTEADFLCYVVSRSESPIGLSNRVLTSDESNKIADEFQKNPTTNFWNYSTSDLANKMPTLTSIFKAVTVLPNLNFTSYRNEGLTYGKKYYFAITVFLKNGRSYTTSAEFALETAPNFSQSRSCDLLFAYADLGTTVYEIDIDNYDYIYVSGVSWNIARHYRTNATPAWDYFLTSTTLNGAFNTLGYIWEGQSLLLSQFTNYVYTVGAGLVPPFNTLTNLDRFSGFAVDDNSHVYIANTHYETTWRFYQFSNGFAVVNPSNTKGEYSGYNQINDKTTHIYYDRSMDMMYIVGSRDTSVGVNQDIYIFDNATWVTTTRQLLFPNYVRLNGIDLDSSKNIYTSDLEGNYVYKVTRTSAPVNYGTPTVIAGGTGSKLGLFNTIGDVAVDGSGNIYVADTGNNRVQKFDSSGNFLTSLNLKELYGNNYESPRALKYRNNKLYVGCARVIVEIPLN